LSEFLDFDALLTPPVGAGPTKAHPLRWTSGAMALAALLLLAFNAESPRAWTTQLSPNAASQAARLVAEGWWNQTARLGLARPRSTLSGWWDKAQALTWPAGPPVPATRPYR